MLRLLAFAMPLMALLSMVLSPPASAVAAGQRACLSKTEQRAAISHGQAVTLAAAIRAARGTVRGRGAREVVRARLCRRSNGLVYVLTVLARNGKVTHTTVDAATGKVVGAR
jgi:ribose 1,5-bisphosphokinase PhnN